MMNFNEAINYIETELKGGCNPGLGRITTLLNLLNNPHKELKAVHIAGTNGKGSVSAMLSSILKEAGYRVGTYISPHLMDYRERYQINGQMIDEDSFVHYVELLKDKIDYIKKIGEEIPSQFEMLTALFFLYMKEEEVDIVVVEVGLGGRYDATNVLDPMISIITSISHDHMGILGETIEEITFEKAGIIKEGSLTISYPQKHKEAKEVIASISEELKNKVIEIDPQGIKQKEFSIEGQVFDYVYEDKEYNDIKLPLLGDHQLFNAAVVIATSVELRLFSFNIRKEHILKGMEKSDWPGRLSIASQEPLILIDGAHNHDGVTALSKALEKYFKGKRLILVMGMLMDKEYARSIKILSPKADVFIATQPVSDRALDAEGLGYEAKKYCSNVIVEPSLKESINTAKRFYDEDSIICICGSLYLAGEAYEILLKDHFI